MKSGRTYGYRASVRLVDTQNGGGLATKKGNSPGDLVTAVQSDLLLHGLIVTQYKVTGTMPNYGLSLEIQPTRSFFSTQSIQELVDCVIQRQTGMKPAWSQDPSCCVVSCCVTQSTLDLISPGGRNAFAPNAGSGAAVIEHAPTNLAGAAYGAGLTAVTAVEDALRAGVKAATVPFEILTLAIVGIGLMAVFVYAKGSH